MKTKINLIILFLFVLFSDKLMGQVISGEANPCPEVNYQYSFSGVSYTGHYLWSVIDGTIVSQNTNTVVVRWNRNITDEGKWRLRVQYEISGTGGIPGGSTYLDLNVKVKTASRYNISGDKEIPGNFIGTKTYTANIVNPKFPAASFLWTTNTGIQTITTAPTINLSINDTQLRSIMVAGKASNCSEWGEMSKIDVYFTSIITGPAQTCAEDIYTIVNPGIVTLENAANVATLTALGNNQWKVTRIGTANGIVKLRSTVNGRIYDKNIMVGGSTVIGFENLDHLEAYDYETFKVLQGTGNMKYEGSMNLYNYESAGQTSYSWSLVSKSAGSPIVSWTADGNYVQVSSKGSGGWLVLQCVITNGCSIETRNYRFYFGIEPLMP